jgi:hypothetical protein
MTPDPSSAAAIEEPAKTYKDYLEEINGLLADPAYDGWATHTLPNKGPEITPEMLDVPVEYMQEWADQIDRLAFKRA